MSDLLQTIKDSVVQDIGEWVNWNEFKEGTNLQARQEYMMNEVCKRYAFEVAKDALKNASENFQYIQKRVDDSDSPVPKYVREVYKPSILDESNIKL